MNFTLCSPDGADDKDAKEGGQDDEDAKDEEGGDGKFEYVTGDQKGSSQVCTLIEAERRSRRCFFMYLVRGFSI